MLSIIFNSENKKIESLLNSSLKSIQNYFINNEEAFYCCCLEYQNHLSNELSLNENTLFISKQEIVEKSFHVSGQFDFEYYIKIDYSSDPNAEKIYENVMFMLEGGKEKDVPHPMPYSKSGIWTEPQMKIISKIENVIVYTREEILAMEFDNE